MRETIALEVCPDVMLEIIEGADHMSLVTHPERIADLITLALGTAI